MRRAVLGIVLFLAACGGGTAASTAPPVTEPDPAVVIAADEYRFIPATVTVPQGSIVQLRNEGGLAHTWTVLAEPIDGEEQLATASKLAEGRVEVGQTARIDLNGIDRGTYQVICAIPGHVSAGMVGELVIQGG